MERNKCEECEHFDQCEIKIIIHNPVKVFDENIGVGNQVTKKAILFDHKFKISKGDKIAQITLIEHKGYLLGVNSNDERTGGFGSTDEKENWKDKPYISGFEPEA